MQVDAKGILYMIAKRFDLKRDSIEDRLKLQKTIYLLEAYGMQLGYGFSWYKYGPYSQDLVRDAYTVLRSEKNVYENATSSWRFSETTEGKIGEFKNNYASVLDDLQQLELVASVDFVCSTWQPDFKNEDDFVGIFKNHKTEYLDKTKIDDDEIKKAFVISKELRRAGNT